MRISNAEHQRHPWLMSRIAPDFVLLDAWDLPAEGGRDDFPALVEIVTRLDPTAGNWSAATRALFALRFRIGGVLGWDGPPAQHASRSTASSLATCVPENIRDTTTPPASVGGATFIPVYRSRDEWAAEISNRTVHAVLQLGWVQRRRGIYRGRLGVYVKPRGALGEAYLALIAPFRHLVVYPELLRQVGRAWKERTSAAANSRPLGDSAEAHASRQDVSR